MKVAELYPRVFLENKRQSVYIQLHVDASVEIKIQPMESYHIPHGKPPRLDEEERYPYIPTKRVGEGLYSAEYDFPVGGRYTVRVRNGENVIFNGYLYALTAELAALRPFKGETHCHTNRSDGVNEPYELMLRYFAAGFDFAAVTDHHKYAPSVEAREAMTPLSDMFTVFHGEEVHNKSMGYFHVVNFGGEYSINEIIQNNDEYVSSELSRIKSERRFPVGVNPELAAYRIFISNEIRRAGGVSILAHPFWEAYGEYNMERRELEYHLSAGNFDALELFAGNDNNGNGDNLEIALWGDLRARGINSPVLGASDNHNPDAAKTRFNHNLSLVLAHDTADIPNAIKRGSAVAVKRYTDTDFLVIGEYSLVAYARFLLAEMYPTYARLTEMIAEQIKSAGSQAETVASLKREALEYRNRFFAQGINR